MIKLVEVNEANWLEIRSLSVSEGQDAFLDSPVGILARGYVYRRNKLRRETAREAGKEVFWAGFPIKIFYGWRNGNVWSNSGRYDRSTI